MNLRLLAAAVSCLLSAGTAHAAPVLVALPPTEAPAAWESALAIAGLQLAPRTGSPRILVLDDGARWRIRAHGGDGRWREASIVPPRTPAAREDAMFLAQSLLHASDIGSGWNALPGQRPASLPRAPAPKPAAPRPAPRRPVPETPASPQRPAEPPPAEPAAAPEPHPTHPAEPPLSPQPPVRPAEPPVRPTPAPPPPPAPTPQRTPRPAQSVWAKPAHPPSTSWTLNPRAGVGAAFRARPGETFTGDVEVGVGVGVGAWASLGVHGAVAPPTELLGPGGERTLMEVDIAAGGAVELQGELHPGFAVHAGAGWRSFSDAGAPVAQGWTPILGARAGLRVPMGASMSMEPWMEGLAELRPIDLVVDGSRRRLPPFVARAGLRFVLKTRDRAASLPTQ